jgi:hypothetical protein
MTLNKQAVDNPPSGEDKLLEAHETLDVLAETEPRLPKVVEMCDVGAYSEVGIGEALGPTECIVRRDWDKARLLLAHGLDGSQQTQ